MDILAHLEKVIGDRRNASPDESYVASLNARGMPVIARKVGEEGVETVVAALTGDDGELIGEAADLVFHLLVLLQARGLTFADVRAELARREGVSGHEEKAARSE